MKAPEERDRVLARRARLVAVVIVATVVVWFGAMWLGPRLGLPGRYAFLFDFAAMAAFLWAFVVTFQIWRRRRDNEG